MQCKANLLEIVIALGSRACCTAGNSDAIKMQVPKNMTAHAATAMMAVVMLLKLPPDFARV